MNVPMKRAVQLSIEVTLAFVWAPAFAAVNVGPDQEYQSIGEAISQASPNDTIFVHPGVYTGVDNRNMLVHQQGLRVVGVGGAKSVVIDLFDAEDDDRRALTIQVGEGDPVHISGFTIRNGFVSSQDGGAVRVLASHVVMTLCVLENNSAGRGGAVYAEESTISMNHCHFEGNTAEDGGGAVCLRGEAVSVIDSCNFSGNEVTSLVGYGGALDIRASSAAVSNCELTGNTSTSGGGVHLGGGSIAEFQRCQIMGNSAGGHWRGRGGGVYVDNSQLDASYCLIAENVNTGDHPWGGGGLAARSAAVLLENCTIASNRIDSFTGAGGGIFVEEDTVVDMSRSILWRNCSSTIGQDILIDSPYGTVNFECCRVDWSEMSSIGGTFGDIGDNFEDDPLFCVFGSCWAAPMVAGSYSVGPESPCSPTGAPCGLLVGAVPVDSGCVGASIPSVGGQALALEVRPNPTSGVCRMQIPVSDDVDRITIYNATGGAVWTKNVDRGEVVVWPGVLDNGRSATAGVYFVQVSAATGLAVAAKRVVVVR